MWLMLDWVGILGEAGFTTGRSKITTSYMYPQIPNTYTCTGISTPTGVGTIVFMGWEQYPRAMYGSYMQEDVCRREIG